LPLEDNVADLIMAWTVFRHVPEGVFAAYLREAHRVLRSGGIFAFEAQNREVGPIERSDGHRPYPEREYRRSELVEHCANAGFIWGAEVERPSATPGTVTLVVAMRKP
jgi:ubiquinone/menaquinone biosynthesis C-methylase UbiE